MNFWTKLFVVWKLVILQLSRKLQASKCQTSISGIALIDYTFMVLYDKNIHTCYVECKRYKACQSINYFRAGGLCHLNNRSITTKPERRVVMADSVYFEHPEPTAIGSHKESPAESCMEIKRVGSIVNSGFYWLKHPLTNIISQIYCNMLTGEADGCFSSPCKNQGTCTNKKHGDYNCSCTVAFTGAKCELPRDQTCAVYSILNETDRSINQPITDLKCDNNLVTKWYRFTGSAGSRLPTSIPSIKRCNTDATGWLNGAHPSV
ncbi:uromodulin-like, partial [Actinia tenebrosa]|uniref:Uromodulin-like n=1 Tax=Actinia tenebrosa TaxID=6105 RepID=A0A6P8HKT7_ACTTE